MKLLLAFTTFILVTAVSAQPVIHKEDYGWTNGRIRNFRVGGFSSSSYDLTTGTGKTWSFTTPTGTNYQNTSFVSVSGNTTYPTANLRMDYDQIISGYPGSGSTYLAVGDSDIYQLGYTGAPNLIWNPPIPTGLPHRLNKTWQGTSSYGMGSYAITGLVVSTGTVTTVLGTFPAVMVRYYYNGGALAYYAYQWETVEYGIVAMANTLNGGILYVCNQATQNSAVDENFAQPLQFKLGDVYPNPTNGSATIRLSIPTKTQMRISVVNLLGEEVGQIANGAIGAGERRFSFGTEQLASGNYWIVVNADGKQEQIKPISIVR